MSVFRKLVLMGLAALALCAAVASSASALTAFTMDPSNTALTVGQAVSGTTTGTSTLSGSFFGIGNTVTCTHSSVSGAVLSNGGSTVTGSITSATWSGCSSTSVPGGCSVTALGLPWNASNSGGMVATSTTSVGVSPGTSGSVDVSSCMPFGSTCTMTGATASSGGLSNVVVGAWANVTTGQLTLSGQNNVKAKTCTASNPEWKANYTLSSLLGGVKYHVTLRTP